MLTNPFFWLSLLAFASAYFFAWRTGLLHKLLTERPVTAWLARTIKNVRLLCDPAIDFGLRLWAFFGPRLTNRAMIAVVLADIAVALHLQVSQTGLDMTSLLIWVAANLCTPLSTPNAPSSIPPSNRGPISGPGAQMELLNI